MPTQISITEIAKGARVRQTPSGTALVRMFRVDGLDATKSDNVARCLTAVDASTGLRIPQYMEPHPTVANMTVAERETEVPGSEESPARSSCNVYCVYKSPDLFPGQNLTQVEIYSVNETKLLNRWVSGPQAGKPILIGAYADVTTGDLKSQANFPAQFDPAGIAGMKQVGVHFDFAEVPVLGGGILLVFTRRETNQPLVLRYRKRTNSRKWNGLPPGCWLCREIQSTQVWAGVNSTTNGWQTRYTFQSCDPDDLQFATQDYGGFSQVIYYKDPQTGQALPGASPSRGDYNGYTIIDPYTRVDFGQLKLPTIYSSI